MNNDPEFRPKWENRQAIIFSTLIFCAVVVLYVMINGEDTRLNETITIGAFALAGGVIGSYVFGAVWEDRATIQTRSRR